MLDIKFVRAHPEVIRADLEKRQDTEKLAWVDTVLELDILKRELEGKNNELRARRNQIAKDINAAKKAGEDPKPLFVEAKELPAKIKENDDKMAEAVDQMKYYLMRLPNILHESVPFGKDDTENVVVKTVGKPRDFGFELKNHGEIAAENGRPTFVICHQPLKDTHNEKNAFGSITNAGGHVGDQSITVKKILSKYKNVFFIIVYIQNFCYIKDFSLYLMQQAGL